MVSIEKVKFFFFVFLMNKRRNDVIFLNLVDQGNYGPVRSFQRTFTCSQTPSG